MLRKDRTLSLGLGFDHCDVQAQQKMSLGSELCVGEMLEQQLTAGALKPDGLGFRSCILCV